MMIKWINEKRFYKRRIIVVKLFPKWLNKSVVNKWSDFNLQYIFPYWIYVMLRDGFLAHTYHVNSIDLSQQAVGSLYDWLSRRE